MVIIQLAGGLGNQMFGYALYLQLQALGRQVKIDDRTKYQRPDARPVQLREVFGVDYEKASEEEIVRLTDSSMAFFSRVRRKLTGRRSFSYEERDKRFDPKVLELADAYLEGYWQSERYFEGVSRQVRKEFSFSGVPHSDWLQDYLIRIERQPSVSVHVRRGDYLEAAGTFGGICTEEYYRKAAARMRENHPGCRFFVFTNDPDWARAHLAAPDMTVVEGSAEETGYLDLYLMTRCEHHICANSSFSWWGAWLGDAPDKEVLAPARWFNGWDCRDIYTAQMLRIEC